MRSSSLVSFLLFVPFGTFAQTLVVSKDATCGGSKGYTCLGSKWGNCCSKYGWCGSTSAYCGDGCNSKFGTCNAVASSSAAMSLSSTRASSFSSASSTRTTAAASASSQPISANARCGPLFGGRTCLGSKWGDCCSQYSYCGSTLAYCEASTCQKGYGKCNTVSSSSAQKSSTVQSSFVTVPSSAISSSAQQSSTAATPQSSSSTSQSSSSTVQSSSSIVLSSASSSISLSSSTPLSSSTVAVTPSPTPSVCPYTTVSSCTAFTGTFAAMCPSSNSQCLNGYQAVCGKQAQSVSIINSFQGSEIATADKCVAKCDADTNCLGVTHMVSLGGGCWLWSRISAQFAPEFGVSSTTYPTNVFVKLCPNVPANSATVLSSSSSLSRSSSSSSALSTMTSSVISTSTTPSSSSVASASTPSSSSSIVSSSSIIPSSSASTMSTIVSPSASSTTPASSSTPSVCPYTTVLGCSPYTTGSMAAACSATDNNKKCSSGYQITCDTAILSGTVITLDFGKTVDQCLASCNGLSTCVAAQYSSGLCKLWSRTLSEYSVAGATTFYKLCPVADAGALSSSSSIASSSTVVPTSTSTMSTAVSSPVSSLASSSSSIASSSSVAPSSSSILASSTTPSSTSSTPTPSTCPYLDLPACDSFTETFATACSAGRNNYCKSGFLLHCGSTVGRGVVDQIADTDQDSCVEACRSRSACAVAEFSVVGSVCQLYSGREFLETASSGTTIFFKTCLPGSTGTVTSNNA